MCVGGAVFSDEVDAAVEDTHRCPIMLVPSSGPPGITSPLGRGCLGDMSRVCWFNVGLSCLIGVLVTGHGRRQSTYGDDNAGLKQMVIPRGPRWVSVEAYTAGWSAVEGPVVDWVLCALVNVC